MTIDPTIQAKLDKAIRELLNARMNTHKVRDLLSRQESFGKYVGCTPSAILDRANGICREINANYRTAVNETISKMRKEYQDVARRFFCE